MQSNFVKTISYFPGFLLLISMIILPASYQGTKAVLIAFVMSQVALIMAISGKLNLSPRIFFLFLFYILLGFTYGVYGLFRGNEGALDVTKEIVLYVIVYMFLISGLRTIDMLALIHEAIVISNILLCLYILNLVLHYSGVTPNWMFIDLYKDTTATQNVSLGMLNVRGTLGMSLSFFPSFMFLQPYLITHVTVSQRGSLIAEKYLIFINTIVMILCGKRILLLIAIVSPILIPITVSLLKHRLKICKKTTFIKILVFIFLALSIALYFNYDFSLIYNFFTEGLKPVGDAGLDPRSVQFYALLNGWASKPLFGYGSGGVYYPYIRSESSPWLYELSYSKYLYDFGLFGFLLYGVGIIYLWIKLVQVYFIDKFTGKYALAAAFGSMFFLMGNATNPYLLKFDYLFTIFLPVAILNLWFLKRNRSTLQRMSRYVSK